MLFKSWQLWRCILWDLSFGNSSWASAAVCLSPAETISLLKSFTKTLGRSQLSCWMKTNCLKWQQVVVETDGGKEAVAEKRSRQPSLWEGWPGDQLGGRVPSLAYQTYSSTPAQCSEAYFKDLVRLPVAGYLVSAVHALKGNDSHALRAAGRCIRNVVRKHCQRHYGPRRWLLWPVILVW